jgi:NIMA (never in mitosis gene a)-related kinase
MDAYENLELLGHGSFGRVWKSRHKETGEIVAIKEIDFGTMQRREKQLLVNEVNVLRKLNNAHIVKYVDRCVKKDSKKIYIVMEFCPGGDLQHLITSTRGHCQQISEDQIWLTLSELASALFDCHHGEERVLHRDIKPANVFIDGDGHVKLGDFGLARNLTSDFANTMVGTPFYMSPELVSGRGYDEKSDIWALGCVLYEMATLRPPFNSILRSEEELKRNITRSSPKRIPNIYSDALWSCICSLIEKDPTKRPSAQEILKIRNVALTIKLGQLRRELLAVRQKTVNLREQEAAQRARLDRITRLESRVKGNENAPVNFELI